MKGIVEEKPWIVSTLPIKGAGGGRLDFDKSYIVNALVASREHKVKSTGITVGEEIAHNVNTLLDIEAGDKIADLGCGPGLIAKYLLHEIGETGRLYCVDASEAMLTRAIKSVNETKTVAAGNTTFINGDIHVVDKLIPEKLDGILLSGNVHLLTNRLMAFRAMRKLLKPDGKLVVVCHAYFHGQESTNSFAGAVDNLRENRPDLKVDGLRLPMMSAKELHEVMRTIEQSGLNVQAHDNDTFAPDVNWVFGWPPQQTIIKRLEVLMPQATESQRTLIALGALNDVASGRPSQVYLHCSQQPHPFQILKS